ncbi:9-O-acetylesterase [Cerasicoccus arenae]|uniref:9-O-acetylesterase n=1 Tax=Cerasicoccus arenae TaxID=424488 RepID=A0A8J3DIS9_9BACT|nr:9-O-acetylesterase [Cerasicoccus arenae]
MIGDGAVIQRHAAIKIWGEADPAANVSATFDGKELIANADASGDWLIEFPAKDAGGPYRITVRSGDDTLIVSDVMVGDVWVCTGQSNMYFTVNKCIDADAAVAEASNPNLRLFTVKRTAADEPVKNVQGSWLPCNPYTVGGFSAVGYFFGDAIQRETDIPIGLIMSTVGGTLASNWTSREVLENNPEASSHFERYEREKAAYPEALAAYKEAVKTNPKAEKPRGPEKRQPTGYYNGMIAPLFAYPIAGVIWYQGESDSWQHERYNRFLHDLIDNWRIGWNEPEMPFLIVQLAGFEGKSGVNENYPEIREIQRRIAMEANNGLAVAIDVGEAKDIHPRNKRPVGERLAKVALVQVYGQETPYMGPTPETITLANGDVTVRFKTGAGALVDQDGGDLPGFELADASGKFFPSEARLSGDSVIVSSPRVKQPTAVRYAWTGFPKVDLYNEAGLPASPFQESITQ